MISAVSANENLTEISDNLDGEIVASDEMLAVSNDWGNEIIGDDDNASTFDDLTREIEDIDDGGVINLTRDYKYVSSSKEGITINKNITINGNNHKIDGNGQSRIFTVKGNVTLNDIVLVNGNHEQGGAIYVNSSVTCNNVIFENNNAVEGGAVYVIGSVFVNDCIFDGNHADKGSAVYVKYNWISPTPDEDYNDTDDYNDSDDDYNYTDDDYNETDDDYNYTDDDYNGTDDYDDEESPDDDEYEEMWVDMEFTYIITNSIFKNSHNVSGGLVYFDSIDPIMIVNSTFENSTSVYGAAFTSRYCSLYFINSTFRDLHSSLSGGAISAYMPTRMYFVNCSFINTSAYSNGGAICADVNGVEWDADNEIVIKNTTFRNSKSNFGGVLVQVGGRLSVYDSIFEDNYAQYEGGAIYATYCKSKIKNSTFENNKINYSGNGGAIYSFKETLAVNGSQFINNSYNAIYSCDNEYDIRNSFFYNNTQAIYSIYPKSSVLVNNNYTNDALAENSSDDGYYVLVINSTGIQIILIKNDFHVDKLPSRYDSRDWGWITPVKDQKDTGACWIFATAATLEASLLKSTGIEYSVSLNNLQKNALKYSKYGHSILPEDGKNSIAAELIVSWYGAIPGEYDSFDMYGKIANAIVSEDAFHVQDFLWLSNRKNATDNDEIKRAIMKYGAVAAGVSMSDDAPYFNVNTSALYDDKANGIAGHSICIVGWDDDYPAGNFIRTPQGDGAWIVKNSYGTSNYDNGYIYVSYYDTVIGNESDAIAFILENTENYNKNYQTDICGEIILLNGTDGYVYKNTYRAIDDDFISAVGTYFNSEGEEYSLEIYVNNKLKYTQSGVAPFRGFHTVKLTTYIPVKRGDAFSVVMKKSSLPILNSSMQHFRIGDSLVYEGGLWKDLSLDNVTASLKVYTKPLENLKTTINANNVNAVYNGGKYLTVTVKDVYGNVLKGVKVTIRLSNGVQKTLSTDSKGQVKFSTNGLVPKTYTATITTQAFGKYVKTSSSAKIVVERAKPKITVKNKVFRVKTKTKVVRVTLKSNKKAIKNAKITIKVNGRSYSAKTNKYGIAKLKVTKLAKKGKFRAVIKFAGSKLYKQTSRIIIIKVKK